MPAGRIDAGSVGHAGGHDAHCGNCGTALLGRYCHACGQAAHVHRSLWHLGEELLHGLFHFDAKGLRTLPLLVLQPGVLTRRYIDGQRMRYVSPLALFLFMVFLTFFAASLSHGPLGGGDYGRVGAALQKEESKARAEVDAATRRLDSAKAGTGSIEAAQRQLDAARSELDSLRSAASAVGDASQAAASGASGAGRHWSALGAGQHQVPPWAMVLREQTIDTGSERLDTALRRAADNPDLTLYKLKSTAYKDSFLLVPISLPFLWAMFFWHRGVTMYDHAVFALYSLSFMSLLAIALMALDAAHLGAVVPWLAWVVPPLHIASQLRGTYRLGRWGAVWRTAALVVFAAVVLAVFLVFVVFLTMG